MDNAEVNCGEFTVVWNTSERNCEVKSDHPIEPQFVADRLAEETDNLIEAFGTHYTKNLQWGWCRRARYTPPAALCDALAKLGMHISNYQTADDLVDGIYGFEHTIKHDYGTFYMQVCQQLGKYTFRRGGAARFEDLIALFDAYMVHGSQFMREAAPYAKQGLLATEARHMADESVSQILKNLQAKYPDPQPLP